MGKIERVDLLARLYGRVVVTPAVWEEAIAKGKAMGARNASYPEKASEEDGFARVALTEIESDLVQRLSEEAGIGLGEAEVLAVAKARNALAVLDDKAGRALAVGMGVSHIGTAGLLLEAFLRGLLRYNELLEVLERLARVAWISPELLAGILRRARGVEDR